LAGFVVGAARVHLGIHHLAARQLPDQQGARLPQRHRVWPDPLVVDRLLDRRLVLGSQVVAGPALPGRALAGGGLGRALLRLLQLAQALFGQLGLARGLLALAADLGQLFVALGLFGLGGQAALGFGFLLALALGQV